MSRTTPGVVAGLIAVLVSLLIPEAGPARALGQEDARVRAPELEPSLGWINTDRPLRLGKELAGHVVLLDFWTYCCINCIHVLPDLEYLQEKYKDEPFVVVGVHSAKFDAESRPDNVRQAAARYDRTDPIVVDKDMRIWRSYGVRAWPSFVLIDSAGLAVGVASGEGHRQTLDAAIARLLEEGRAEGTLAAERVEIRREADTADLQRLRFPGKVLAVAPGTVDADGLRDGRVFVSDSSHDRVLELEWPADDGEARVVRAWGDGVRGLVDGAPVGSPDGSEPAQFHDPQGLSFDAKGRRLFVADMKNHAVREIDLANGRVTTLAGTGEQSYDRRGGKRGLEQGLASPWAVAFDPARDALHVAMAGTHQLWTIDLVDGRARATAGSGVENVYDAQGLDAALAQPSGFAFSADGRELFFTDTEGSAIRSFEVGTGEVRTIIGRAVASPRGDSSLFDFGDIDGSYPDARLQHAIGITRAPASAFAVGEVGEVLVIADTYNDKLKIVRPGARSVETWWAEADGAAALDEPAGLSWAQGPDGRGWLFVADTNNSRLVRIDPATRELVEVRLVWEGAGRAAE